MDLCVHFEKPACIVFISSLFVIWFFKYTVFNSIQFQSWELSARATWPNSLNYFMNGIKSLRDVFSLIIISSRLPFAES